VVRAEVDELGVVKPEELFGPALGKAVGVLEAVDQAGEADDAIIEVADGWRGMMAGNVARVATPVETLTGLEVDEFVEPCLDDGQPAAKPVGVLRVVVEPGSVVLILEEGDGPVDKPADRPLQPQGWGEPPEDPQNDRRDLHGAEYRAA